MFMCRANDADDQLLIQHTVPVTGGMSGSPLIDKSGKVIGIVSGGNTAQRRQRGHGPRARSGRRANKVNELEIDEDPHPERRYGQFRPANRSARRLCEAERSIGNLPTTGAIGSKAAKKFVKYFENAADQLADLAKEHYGVADTTREKIGEGTLKPSGSGSASYDSKSS